MNLTGPQSDRDRLLSGRWDGSRQALGVEHDPHYDGELARLRRDNESLRSQLTRSLKELKAYQIKYPSPYVYRPEDEDELAAWGDIPEIMTPLLEAYDARIAELEDTIKQQNFNLQTFKERTESLIRENEELRTMNLESLRRNDLGAMPLGTEEAIAELNAQVKLMMDENALMVEQKVHLSQELDKQQDLLEKQAVENSSLKNRVGECLQEIVKEKEKGIEIESERNAAAAEAMHLSEVLGKQEQEIDSLKESLTVTKQRVKEKEQAYLEIKRILDALSLKYKTESDQTVDRVQQIEIRVKELQQQLYSKQHELEQANEVIRKLRTEYTTTRKDAEGMLQVMGGLERQIQEYANREESVQKQSLVAREKVQEALTIKEQANAKVSQYEQEVNRLISERKALLLTRQNDIDRAVEKVKDVFQEKIASYERELEAAGKNRADLMIEAERASRECKSTRDVFDQLERVYQEKHSSTDEHLQRLADEFKLLARRSESELAKRLETEEQNKELRLMVDRERIEVDNCKRMLSQLTRNKELEHKELKDTVKTLTLEVHDYKRQLSKRCQEYEEQSQAHEQEIQTLTKKQEHEIALLKLKVQELEKWNLELETTNISQDKRNQNMIDELKEKYKSQCMSLESRLKAELERFKILVSKNKTNEILMNELTEEKITLGRIVEEAREALKSQDEEIGTLKNTINELTHQLTSSQYKREEAVYRAAKAIEELNIRGLSPVHTPSQSVFGITDNPVIGMTASGAPHLSPFQR